MPASDSLLFDFALPRVFDFDQKLVQNVAQIILYYHVTKQFLAWVDWSLAFDFRIYFGITFVAFDFDE